MTDSLTISVRLHEGWYHGSGSIPSPARLFQALVAGQGLSGPLRPQSIQALEWLERQPPPIVAAPVTKAGQSVATYVPNNDLDAKQGDHQRIGEIRTKKSAQPLLFDDSVPFQFCWEVTEKNRDATAIEHLCDLANGVYQLGRTVDAAWAWADVLTADELGNRLQSHRGPILRPAVGPGNVECPTPGTLRSLATRHADMSQRYGMTADGKGQTFRRRSKPKWRMVSYSNATTQFCFDLLDRKTSTLVAWPATGAVALVTNVRDAAVARLAAALPDCEAEINQTLIGRKPSGENAAPTSSRVRIIPLPSIGHEHADQQIRRLLIEIPGNCPLRTDDVIWAFSGQEISSDGRQDDRRIDLVKAQPHRQLEHYGITSTPSRFWQTVTPVALSSARRRRIEPDRSKRQSSDLKGTAERRMEQEIAAAEIRQALRRAGFDAVVQSVRVQREPFTAHGLRAEDFAAEPRFSKHVLWHVSLELTEPIQGPVCLGDGRFLGLGLMSPVTSRHEPSTSSRNTSSGTTNTRGVFAFAIDSGMLPDADPVVLARALRRAVMARVQETLGPHAQLPTFFSGHYPDGSPAKSERTPHLVFQYDPAGQRLLVISPGNLDARSSRHQSKHLATLESALADFRQLQAGTAGHLQLQPTAISPVNDHLFGPSRYWKSATPYAVNRHAKRTTALRIIHNDVINECERRGLPRPEVTVLDWQAQSGIGLQASLELKFATALNGLVVLGKTRHLGGGLFAAT